MQNQFLVVLKGMAMGIAEIIPGVSGGTIAFITGIYETLLTSIASINLSLIGTFKAEGLKGVLKKINGKFLLFLFIGMGLGIVAGVFTISHFLETHPNLVWALFFGIIFASVFYIGAQISIWNLKNILLFVLFTVLTIWITNLNPSSGSESYIYIFLAGFIAISALMLPGISGSFMLLLMGMYTFIVHDHLKNILSFQWESLWVIGVFGLGCLTGVFTFARLLKWTFDKYRNGTLAALTGILLGSLYKIWPWRNPAIFLDKESGNLLNASDLDPASWINNESYKVVKEMNVLPANYYTESELILVCICFVIGMALVYIMHRSSKPNN